MPFWFWENNMEKDLSKILPHDKPMILIDELLEVSLESHYAKVSVTINEDKIFFNKEINGISPLAGIEFMAQTIGVLRLFQSRRKHS